MSEIRTFAFSKEGFDDIKSFPKGKDWPVVYIIENGKEVYIGETTSAVARGKQHLANEKRSHLERVHIIFDDEYNKSAALDTESLLIQYFAAEGTLKLQNGNRGLLDHNYFNKDVYRSRLESTVWQNLKQLGLVSRDILAIKNSEMFKFSPYKALTEDQMVVAEELTEAIMSTPAGTHLVHGGPGTGKSVLATYLMKALKGSEKTRHLDIGLVVPMPGLRESLRNVFSYVEGLSPDMVIGPTAVANKKYDVLIVDEAHRLRQRRNLANYASHDEANRKLGLGKEGTELDWVLMQSSHQILFYDEKQTIRPTDVHATRFSELHATHHYLTSQLRISGGENYINFIDGILNGSEELNSDFNTYDFKIYDDVREMVEAVKAKNDEMGLCRIVAGYAWPWVSRDNPETFDIIIGGAKLKWNSKLRDWVNSPNAINEVGCIHTVQGYDLNYVGVIVGSELAYDHDLGKFVVRQDQYHDQNGRRGIFSEEELERYIFNIYKTLMTRGMRGCYVYFVDKDLERYFKSKLKKADLDPTDSA